MMVKKSLQKGLLEKATLEKEEAQKEFRRNIIIGSVLRSLHRQQGTMPYLLQIVEPYLRKADRQLFGLPF